MKTAALYIRVSTHNQEELSPDAQKRLLLEFAKANNYLVDKDFIFIEGGISGRKANKRPEFQRMVGYAKTKEHPFDAILIWKFSRFARNQEESILYKSLLRRKKVDVISISEPMVEGPFGELIERIIEWMDEYYSIRLSSEVMKGMTENAIRGGYQASPPLGYAIDYKGANPRIVPEEAAIVKRIYSLYLDDHKSPHQITKILNDLGLKTKRGNQFEKRTVLYILQNPTYAAMTRWNMRDQTESTQRIKNKSEWIISEGHFEPIISREIFEQAQKKWESTYHPKNAKPVTHQKHWLSGMVKCHTCGRSLSVSQHRVRAGGNTYINFQCYGYLKGKCTVSHQISALKLVPAILASIKSVINTGTIDVDILPIQQKRIQNSDGDLIKMQLDKLNVKEKRIKAAYINAIDTLEEYKTNKEMLLRERERLNFELSKCVPTVEPFDEKSYLKSVSRVYDILVNDECPYDLKQRAIQSIISKIEFNSETKSINISYIYSGTLDL